MATTSHTQSTLREYYTWGSADFTWEAQQCNEQVAWFGIYDHTQSSTETVTVSDKVYGEFDQACHYEVIGIVDRSPKTLAKQNAESINFACDFWSGQLFINWFLESLQIAEQLNRSTRNPHSERVVVAEHNNAKITQAVKELVAVAELVTRVFNSYRQFDEDISINDLLKNTYSKFDNEIINVDEEWWREVSKRLFEQIDASDLITHCATFKRLISEALTALDNHAGKYCDNQSEALHIKEAFLRACQGVLADVGVYSGGITLDDFYKVIKQPSGYEPFIPYVVGEYEYEQALVRLLVKAGSMGSQPAVYDAVVNVDIDDTVDRGTVDITDTSAPTKVYFNKHYYTKPEVAVTLQAGNTADGAITPNIKSISSDDDGFYFTVELLKSNGTRTTGRISWNSVGY